MTVTRKDVAEYAKVSVATVSYVMNQTKNVTPEVRQRVEDAIRILNYQPNQVARSLSTKRTNHVAILVNNLKNPYYSELLEGAQSKAAEYGYIVSIIMVDYANRDAILELTARGVDGVIITVTGAKEIADHLDGCCCLCLDQMDQSFLDVDYRQAIFDAVAALAKYGHTRIAYLSGLKMDDAQSEHPRLYYLKEAFAHYGLKEISGLFIDGNEKQSTDEEAGIEATRRLLASGEPFTAILAINDLMAVGAINELRANGLRVPEDVSVIGCDNSQIFQYLSPPLATLDVQPFRYGSLLMEWLIKKIKDIPFEGEKIIARYIQRGSVGICQSPTAVDENA